MRALCASRSSAADFPPSTRASGHASGCVRVFTSTMIRRFDEASLKTRSASSRPRRMLRARSTSPCEMSHCAPASSPLAPSSWCRARATPNTVRPQEVDGLEQDESSGAPRRRRDGRLAQDRWFTVLADGVRSTGAEATMRSVRAMEAGSMPASINCSLRSPW